MQIWYIGQELGYFNKGTKVEQSSYCARIYADGIFEDLCLGKVTMVQQILEMLARFRGLERILEVLAGFSTILEVSAGFQRS